MTPIKYILILLATLIGLQTTEGQITNYNYTIIVNNSIERIDEWKFNYDSSGKFIDSINTSQLIYDRKGDLIEEKTQHEDQGDWAKGKEIWTIIKYFYDDDHNLLDSKSHNPYILVNSSCYEEVINKCETFNSYGSLINSVITYKNGKIESWISEYFQHDFMELLTERTIFINGVVSTKYKITYKFKK